MDNSKMKLGQEAVIKATGEIGTILAFDPVCHTDACKYFISGTDGRSDTWNIVSILKDFDKIHVHEKATGDQSGIWVDDTEIEFLNSEFPVLVKEQESKNNFTYVRRFKSGAVRSDDRGREKPSFISPYAIKFLAQHFSENAAFFNNSDSAKNYMKGIEPIDVEDSLERHILDFKFAMMPNRRHDVKPIKKALVEIMANCVMALHQIGLDEDGQYAEIHEKTEYIKKED